jgi:hypothetical protein
MSYKSVILEDSPVLYYRLGEASGTSAADSSGHSLPGTYKNSPTLGVTGALVGDANTAVTLNGTNQFIERANSATLNVGDVFTFEAWLKRAENARAADVFLYKEGTPQTAKFAVTGTNRLQLRVPGVKTIVESTTEVKADGAWHHVVATKNGSAVHLYVDGVDVTGTVTNETCGNNTATLTIGAENAAEEFFKGSLDEVAIYPTALSETRVKAHYSAAFPPTEYSATVSETLSPSQNVARAVANKRSSFDSTAVARIYWGADIDGDVYSIGQNDAPYNATTYNTFEEHAGASPTIVHYSDPFLTWDGFGTPSSSRVGERGAIVMKSIGGTLTQLNEVSEGKLDATIETWATAAAAYGKPVFLRPWWEANGTWWAWGRATNYVTAWKRLYEKINAKASNVSLVYCPNIIFDTPSLEYLVSMYPGDAFVDWTGMDGYAGENPLKLVSHKNPQETFEATYNKLLEIAPSKPIMIGETATSEYGNDKARWIKELFQNAMPAKFPQIKAVVWFNDNIVAGEGRLDWPIESSASAQAAFKEAITGHFYVNAPLTLTNAKPIVPSGRQQESPLRVAAFPRTPSEALSTSDAPTRASTVSRKPTETLTTSDAITRATAVVRAVSQVLTTSDGITRATAAARSVSESLAASDVVGTLRTFARSVKEWLNSTWPEEGTYPEEGQYTNVGASDTVIRTTAVGRATNETLPTLDTNSRAVVVNRTNSDTLTTSDTVTRSTTVFRAVSEALTASQSVSRVTSLARSVVVVLSTSDTVKEATVVGRVIAEVLTTADTATHIFAGARTIIETLSTSDSPKHTGNVTRNVADTLTTSDTVGRLAGGFGRNVVQINVLSDVVARAYQGFRSVIDVVTGQDSPVRRVSTAYHGEEIVELSWMESTYHITGVAAYELIHQPGESVAYQTGLDGVRVNLVPEQIHIDTPDSDIRITKLFVPQIAQTQYDDKLSLDLVENTTKVNRA